ncbi:MAG: prenyltransferase, partial [Acidilobaceae archaeon]
KFLLSTALTASAGALYAIYVSGSVDPNFSALFAFLILGTILAHIAMHALDDYFDTAEDRNRALPREVLTSFGYNPVLEGKVSLKEALTVGLMAFIGALIIGVYLTLERGPLVLLFALIGALVILGYHYLLTLVLGEAALLAKDFLAFLGSYYVISQDIELYAFLPALALSTAHIAYSVHKVPRAPYDRQGGRKTLSALLGERFWICYLLMVFLLAVFLCLSVFLGHLPPLSLSALFPVVVVFISGFSLRENNPIKPEKLKRLLAINHDAFLVYKAAIVVSLAVAL